MSKANIHIQELRRFIHGILSKTHARSEICQGRHLSFWSHVHCDRLATRCGVLKGFQRAIAFPNDHIQIAVTVQIDKTRRAMETHIDPIKRVGAAGQLGKSSASVIFVKEL